jgi:hypothetical protein
VSLPTVQSIVPHQNCPLPLSKPPPKVLQLSTSTHSFSYCTTPFCELHDTTRICTQFIFHTLRKVGSFRFSSPSNGSLLILSLSLFLTTVLSVEETLMNFGYPYAPNLIHQGASVITEILSANGYRNPASSNNYEFTHGPKLQKNISKRSKTIQPVIKSRCAMTIQGARAHVPSRNEGKTHMHTMCDCGR